MEVEELESLLGPDDINVDFRRILEEARDEKVARCSRPSSQMVRVNSWWSVRDGTSTKGSGTHCGDKIRLLLEVMDGGKEGLEQQRVAWSSSERQAVGAVEDYLEKCADTKVDIEASGRLMEPEDEEVSLRYILKYSTRGGSNIFRLFDTAETKDRFVA